MLDLCAGLTVNVEVKNDPRDPAWDSSRRVVRRLLELLASRDGDDVLVSCFDFGALDLVRSAVPEIPTAMLYLSRRPVDDQLDAARLAALVEWDRQRAWANDGSASAGARLARETGIAGSTARESRGSCGRCRWREPRSTAAASAGRSCGCSPL